MAEFDWTQPVGGKHIKWKTLSVGEEFDQIVAHRRDELKHLLPSALILARILKYGDSERCTMQELRGWDSYDYEAFQEEILMKETIRQLALRRKAAGLGEADALDAQIEETQHAANQLSTALGILIGMARTARASGAGPLDSSKP